MKKILLLSFLFPIALSAQVIATRTNGLNFRSERYVANSPGNTIGNSRVCDYLQDSIAFESTVDSFRVKSVRSSLNHGAPTNILFSATDGLLRVGPVSGLSLTSGQITAALAFTPYDATNPSSFITQAGARTAISLTTTGTSGAATYNNSTGILNIPIYANSGGTVTSVTAGTGLSGGTFTTTGTISMPNTGSVGTYSGLTTDAQGRVTAGTTRSFNNAPSVTIQTVAAAANGTQVSSTRDAEVNYSVTINSTVSLSGNQTGYVVLEICPTNSSTAGDWVEVGRVPSGQSGTLVVGLTLNQVGGGQLGCILPVGYFRRLRSVNTAGTPTYTYNSGQEVLL